MSSARETSVSAAAAGSVASTLLGTVLLGVTGILTARVLGPEAKGAYVLAVLVPHLATNVCALGLTGALVYFIAGGRHAPGAALGTSLSIALSLGIAVTLVGEVAVAALLPHWENASNLALTLWVIPPALGYALFRHALLGLRRYSQFNVFSLVDKALTLALLIGATLGGCGNLRTFCMLYVVSSFASCLLGAALVPSAILRGLRLEAEVARAALHYGLRGHVGWLAELLNYRLDMLLVHSLSGAAALGFYSVAVSVAELLWVLPACVSVVLLPELMRSQQKLISLTPAASRLAVLLAVLGAVALAGVGAPLVHFLYGERFGPALQPFYLLLPGVAAFSTVKILNADFAARGRPGLSSTVAGLSLVVTVVLDVALIPEYAAAGAGAASTLAYLTATLVALSLYTRLSGFAATSLLVPRTEDIRLSWGALRRLAGWQAAGRAGKGPLEGP